MGLKLQTNTFLGIPTGQWKLLVEIFLLEARSDGIDSHVQRRSDKNSAIAFNKIPKWLRRTHQLFHGNHLAKLHYFGRTRNGRQSKNEYSSEQFEVHELFCQKSRILWSLQIKIQRHHCENGNTSFSPDRTGIWYFSGRTNGFYGDELNSLFGL